MRALSIMQPWASLIVGWADDGGSKHRGPKSIENRTWRPSTSLIGQRFAVHASKREDDSVGASLLGAKHIYNPGTSELTANPREYVGRTSPLPSSAIVGVATLAMVVIDRHELRVWNQHHAAAHDDDDEQWYMGGVGLVLRDRIAIDPITGVRGALGFWTLPEDVEHQVIEQLARAS